MSAAPEFYIPGNAVFKIRNLDLDNPITEAYYAANYISVWEELFKSGHTYTSLTDKNVPFTSSELRYINSESGYYMTIPGESGCTMRMAVIGYNKEGRSNELISDKSSGIADCDIQ